jgi:hypothetical protein
MRQLRQRLAMKEVATPRVFHLLVIFINETKLRYRTILCGARFVYLWNPGIEFLNAEYFA